MWGPSLSINTAGGRVAKVEAVSGNITNQTAQVNLAIAWIWMLLGFASGFAMGLFFHRDDWLGGYGSFKRRLYRLAHVAFFGTGFVNFMFWLTAPRLGSGGTTLAVASWAFVVGAITMPLCCVLMAESKRFKLLFGVPVFSLITGAGATLWQLFKL
jgi:hypothetical protein